MLSSIARSPLETLLSLYTLATCTPVVVRPSDRPHRSPPSDAVAGHSRGAGRPWEHTSTVYLHTVQLCAQMERDEGGERVVRLSDEEGPWS
jgi:hypothetical protein